MRMRQTLSAYDVGGDGRNIFGTDSYFPSVEPTFSVEKISPEQASKQTVMMIKESGKMAKAKISGVVNFASWLEKNYPDVYKQVLSDRPDLLLPEFALSGLSGLSANGDMESATPGTDWGKAIADILTPLVGVYQQSELLKLNIKRAEQGLPLIDNSAVAAQVQIGVSPAVRNAGIITGAVLIGVLFLLLKKR